MTAVRNIKNLKELQARQSLLHAKQSMLGSEIIDNGKTALVTLPSGLLLKPKDPLQIIKVDGKINIPGKLFSYLLPLIVNKILFRKSNFIVRIILTMIARRIGKRVGPKVALWLLHTIENLVRNNSTTYNKPFQISQSQSKRLH